MSWCDVILVSEGFWIVFLHWKITLINSFYRHIQKKKKELLFIDLAFWSFLRAILFLFLLNNSWVNCLYFYIYEIYYHVRAKCDEKSLDVNFIFSENNYRRKSFSFFFCCTWEKENIYKHKKNLSTLPVLVFPLAAFPTCSYPYIVQFFSFYSS